MTNFRFAALFTAVFLLALFAPNFPARAQSAPETVPPADFLAGFGAFAAAPLKTTQSAQTGAPTPDAQIKNIQKFGAQSGIAYTSDAVFRTDSGGADWREIAVPKTASAKISTVRFFDALTGWIVLSDGQALNLAKTNDGGATWQTGAINLLSEDAAEADLENALLQFFDRDDLLLSVPLPTSSNFVGDSLYESNDGGATWRRIARDVRLRRDDSIEEKNSGDWTLKSVGACAGKKRGCVQETKIFDRSERDITPPPIKKLAEAEKFAARLEAQNSVFAQAPGGATRVSLQRGFDKCTAATVAQMRAWWDASPFYDANIYLSGRNRGCTQPQLTAAWVTEVSAMGWGLIPTVVGYQAPCSVSTNAAKHSSDPAIAETQGRGEADIAIADANNLGLTAGTVLYYDMERYDEVAATPNCRVSVNAFLKGWTDRLKERGYISGVYGSPTNAVADWINIPAASRMDAVWLARWDNVPSVWFYASPSPAIPAGFWENHQRIKQWQSPHNETWGGVTFNIDGDIADAPVAGAPIAKNKPADFDGDGRTDISVFRPDAGNWFVFGSAAQTISTINFGAADDILAPGDFDGDGKTDAAVFRPSNGYWFILTKGANFNSKQFGQAGDIPVPADYNNDGKTDYAVFRPSNGYWYFTLSDSRSTFLSVQFGQNGDKPAIGDYDGDGRADVAVWRPENGYWYYLKSSDGSFGFAQFGASDDVLAPADYDGDGRTDFAVFRPSSGTWYFQQTTAGFAFRQFGQNGDAPAVGDFDGDGKADQAVYRPSNGTWYILRSRDGFASQQFGAAADKPVPHAYLPQ